MSSLRCFTECGHLPSTQLHLEVHVAESCDCVVFRCCGLDRFVRFFLCETDHLAFLTDFVETMFKTELCFVLLVQILRTLLREKNFSDIASRSHTGLV